jgi:hypothetical protein
MAEIRSLLDRSQEDHVKEQLQFLLNAAEAKLQVFKAEIEKAFLNPEAEKIRIVPDKNIAWYEEYRAGVSEGASQEIGKVIDKFFTGESGVKDGFKTLVQIGLQTLLGSDQVGEQSKKYYFVTIEHNAIIRVDVGCWRYNFSSEGVMGKQKNAFCYVFSKSIVDHKKVSLDTLLYLISEQVGDDLEKVEPFIKKLKSVWNLLEDRSPNEVLKAVKPLL